MNDDEPDIEVVTPQFERQDGVDVDWVPEDTGDINALRSASEEQLKDLGMRPWDADLWLFPAEWYDHIPDGTQVKTISGKIETFKHGETGGDRRFGCLAYGLEPEFTTEEDND